MVVPYKNQSKGKKEQVADMFNSISHKYDFLNHLLSGGIDIIWRKKAIKLLQNKGIKSVLDIATGTGDFAIEALKIKPEKIVGIDISEGMLAPCLLVGFCFATMGGFLDLVKREKPFPNQKKKIGLMSSLIGRMCCSRIFAEEVAP